MFGTFEPEVEPVHYGIEQPLHSNNPIKVFLHGIQRLAAKILRTRGVGNKLWVLVKPPSWSAE